MRRLCTLLLLLLSGCELQIDYGDVGNGSPSLATIAGPDVSACPFKAAAPVEIPLPYRAHNYAGGSCMWASLETVLRSQGQKAIADWCRQNHSGAAGVWDCCRVADSIGLPYAATKNGDAEFLEWCSRTRRAAAIHWSNGAHAVTFCGYNMLGEAVLVDNNRVEQYERIPKAAFLAQWRASGGLAFTTVYWSPPPRPWYLSP
jgi:hypothetical protein